ncbi:putative glutamyl-tRNA amidotransferase subunit A [Hyaloscypha hepaticicola]|uniref:Putative glutamyl-tRNA amidotransferase subunit A n=1 Tax=Hyaloscypha hepaticicola TaxID=2082293 RepID=A0A2J6PIJ9_9HELO|nr:putative glutamyl-tRNA amidotransferase subunit A [Hyaloscypha hepaticicola]
MTLSPQVLSLDIVKLREQYGAKTLSPVEVIRHVYQKIASYHDKAVWIHLIPEAKSLIRAQELIQSHQSKPLPPLFGIPFSVKDSVDIARLPTTLACPSFAYTATATAPVINRILDAGGILIGKTNLDQFATGLTGVRSPYGIPRCVFDSEYICGGSSSGSAVSVAANLVSFTVCTDTGGSTRVPAALNGVVGLKPTLGSISTEGLSPACKNIDCVCVIARTMDDAEHVWSVMKGFDEKDMYARRELPTWEPWHNPIRFGVPPANQLGDLSPAYADLFGQGVTALENELGFTRAEFDYMPFEDANQMLYDSSIVSQRLLAFEPYTTAHGLDSLHPAIKATFQAATENNFSATRAYQDIFTLAHHKREAEVQFRNIDVLVVPSTVGHFTVAELEEEPMARNKVLGRFTNFVNLLDLCAVSVPIGWWKGKNGKELPFGVTVIGQAGKDKEVMAFGERLMEMPKLWFRN